MDHVAGCVDRARLEALDRDDELRAFRDAFELPEGLVYLDGNSLGALPRRARERLASVVRDEWGRGLIASWGDAGWLGMPARIGDKVARLVGAAPGQVVATDSTSVNLFKALSAAVRVDPGRRLVLSERANFPTDLYILEGLLEQLGGRHAAWLVEGGGEGIERALAERGPEVGVVLLTHVDYVSGRMHDMRRLTAAAHRAGAVVVWDLSHSAGAMPLALDACEVDFAVGCGYKFLNGGPGAPAYVYVARRLQERFRQPLSGWMGDASPFEFRGEYRASGGIARYLCGTPPILALAALEAGVDLALEASLEAVRRKSVALGDLFIALVERHAAGLGLELASPREGALRASHVSYRHPRSARIMQALAAKGVVGDCRPPDVLRFGFAPLYVRYVDAWDAAVGLAEAVRDVEGR